ncbi:MAG: hypothetical protein RMK20_06240, partial [Verrucomicrobiales bacterium]|nr:hypothetical protein [Verrucomicrobiales bacterium]
ACRFRRLAENIVSLTALSPEGAEGVVRQSVERGGVAQIGNLLCRRLAVGEAKAPTPGTPNSEL